MHNAEFPSMNKPLGPSYFSYPSLLIAEGKTARRYRHCPCRFLDAKKDTKTLTNSPAKYTYRIYEGSKFKPHTEQIRLVPAGSDQAGGVDPNQLARTAPGTT